MGTMRPQRSSRIVPVIQRNHMNDMEPAGVEERSSEVGSRVGMHGVKSVLPADGAGLLLCEPRASAFIWVFASLAEKSSA